ncbi:threonine--tRNA ligase [Promicromonospora thailandica]|uniref:Threonine--tRNA ligase n=1 Tax=Promicromonospora thailandica TaxID=765201 RepID=A0A9X2G3W2_9MICO|nr:threonine--tRNA ligase [Promicromonospora thailandica]MCP2266617.1 threonyl-tRNA synthetase [Promicromonospora thailandica]BFF17306.1 threonine--tRNA ligase [Promicromonospora thailandica]
MNAPATPVRNAPVDHRELGRDMRIFDTSPLVGPGLPLWLPAGAAVRHELEQYAREVALRTGCEPVYSPVLGKRSLFERSGHWAKFADDMFPPMSLGPDGAPDADPLVLRPANCPHHAQIYAAEPRSYRDLPVRYSELAPMFRAERSGVLSGLSRVRQIDLDDTHVFCRPDQVEAEVRTALAAVLEVLGTLGIEVSYLRLSGRDDTDRWLGDPGRWAAAQAALAAVLDDLAGPRAWRAEPGEAAFYGPKIDVQVLDARGHEETLATVQLDFNQPERFDLTYVAASGDRERVVMIHRGTVGAMERMVAFLLERHAGRLPFWLAPVQLCLLPVSDGAPGDAADALARDLRGRGLRVRVERHGSLGNRIRLARQRRDALLGVLGPREADAGLLAVTDPASGERFSVPLADLPGRLAAAARDRVARPLS